MLVVAMLPIVVLYAVWIPLTLSGKLSGSAYEHGSKVNTNASVEIVIVAASAEPGLSNDESSDMNNMEAELAGFQMLNIGDKGSDNSLPAIAGDPQKYNKVVPLDDESS